MDVELEVDDGVAVITVNRPHSRNAIALDTMEALDKAIDAAAGAGSLVITGAGDRAFVSGGDLKELAAIREESDATAMALRMRGVCDRLAAFPGPVIAEAALEVCERNPAQTSPSLDISPQTRKIACVLTQGCGNPLDGDRALCRPPIGGS